jgi:two-component system NarL family response regulator
MKPENTITVMLVDDHFIVRIGLVSSIDTAPDMRVVAEAATGEEALQLHRRHKPDVTILDLRLPGKSGTEVAAALKAESPEVRILVLSSFEGDEDIYRALEAGALGYLPKSASRDELLQAIRAVHAGQRHVSAAVGARLLERMPRVQLSDREVEILSLIVQGKSNKEIGSVLFVTEATIKFHVTNILQKLNARDRTQAVTEALRRGILHLP